MARLAAFIPSPLRPAARRFRQILRGIESAPVHQLLRPADARAELVPLCGVYTLEKEESFTCPIRVKNLGSAVWSSQGRHPVRLAVRWLTPRKQPLDTLMAYYDLPHPVRPGETAVVPATITVPDSVGHFLVEADLVQTGGTSFRDHGSRPALIDAQVTGRADHDIDYYKVYATADFEKDFWTCVGPSTKEDFDRLGKIKIEMLKRLGMTPNSRIFDIGCGTGQLAIVLEKYLTEQGQYYGTDIGPEAIDYCKKHYRRPNFGFAVSEMTRLPVYGREFDFIVLFSVFTHTYPDETALILAEAKRLLAPNGIIVADMFTNPMVERYSGNRGAVESNREHVLRLVELTGLTADVFQSDTWGKHGNREFYRFSHGS